MAEVDYVSEGAAAMARMWEAQFQDLPASAGIIFVGVRAHPALKGAVSTFDVRLGIHRDLPEETGMAIIKSVLKEEIASGAFHIKAAIFRGVPGAASIGNRAQVGGHPT